MSEIVEIYEDNSGAVYLAKGGEVWALGPVTPDMYGEAVTTAKAWTDGEWSPNELDGQVRIEGTDDLDPIAIWHDKTLNVLTDDAHRPVAGAGGLRYIGFRML